jgi:hypothetical protein
MREIGLIKGLWFDTFNWDEIRQTSKERELSQNNDYSIILSASTGGSCSQSYYAIDEYRRLSY